MKSFIFNLPTEICRILVSIFVSVTFSPLLLPAPKPCSLRAGPRCADLCVSRYLINFGQNIRRTRPRNRITDLYGWLRNQYKVRRATMLNTWLVCTRNNVYVKYVYRVILWINETKFGLLLGLQLYLVSPKVVRREKAVPWPLFFKISFFTQWEPI